MSAEEPREHEGVSEQFNRGVDAKARRYDLVTVDEIKTLTAFHSDVYPVVSLYLDVRPEERQGDKVRAKLKHLLDEAKRRPATRSKQRRKAFQQEAERLLAWFETEYDRTGRGLAVEQATERRVEAERVEALLTAALGHGPGVLGLDRTLEAVVERRVRIFVVEEAFRQPGFECPHCQYLVAIETAHCPLCGRRFDPQLDIVERAVERAIDQRATIEVLRGEARQALAAHGHIGALLRYAI